MKDLSHLPSQTKPEGLAPDDSDEFVTPIVEALREGIDWSLPVEYNPNKPQADADTLTRHSKAATCMKEVALLRDGVEPEPMDDAGLHVTFIGTLIHSAWQKALSLKYDDIEFEVSSSVEGLTSGSADGLRAVIPSERHVLELKTEGEFSYDKQVGVKGPAEGPKSSHMVQLALNVVGHDADSGSIVLLRRSSVSAPQAERFNLSTTRRFGAQFTFTRDQLQPLADEWLAQLKWIAEHDTDDVPRFHPHEMPKGARVVDPTSGRWELREPIDPDGEFGDPSVAIIDTGAVWGGSKCKHYCGVAWACQKAWADGR